MKATEEMRQLARELGIPAADLADPLCRRYLRAKMAVPEPVKYPREPADASGFTDDVEILILYGRAEG